MYVFKFIKMQIWSLVLLATFVGVNSFGNQPENKLKIASNGKANCTIITLQERNAIDEFALKELKNFLHKITGAEFKSVNNSSSQIDKGFSRIYLGWGPLAVKILGEKNSPIHFKDQECAVISKGNELFLYGKGKYGNLYAVYEFLETQLGCRWYSAYGDSFIPKHEHLSIPQVNIKRCYAFPIRGLMTFFYRDKAQACRFHYRNRQNILLSESKGVKQDYIGASCHTLRKYMPGTYFSKKYKMKVEKDYFKTNPEFFSMDKNGNRVSNNQVCFSNKALRKELTKNLLADLKQRLGKKLYQNRKIIMTVDANDVAYRFCHCPGCVALEKKYKSPGGPIYDYLIDICGYMKKHYPNVYIQTLAYQASQTEIPPDVKKMPDNFIVIFAPINSNFVAPLDHSTNSKELKNLQQWCKICKHVWVWYYPNTYLDRPKGFVFSPPVGNIDRLAKDIKIMKQIGVKGTYFEQDSGGIKYGTNFSELQSWVMLKLFQNPYQDIKALIVEFTNFYYGKAAPLMREYLFELEEESQSLIKRNVRWYYTKCDFSYLTMDNIQKWEEMFDKMEALTKSNKTHNYHVKLVRFGLDSAALAMHLKTMKKNLFEKYVERLQTININNTKRHIPGKKLEKWIKKIRETRKLAIPKPLPEQFQKLSKDKVLVIEPEYNKLRRRTRKDKDAHLGKTLYENTKGGIFSLGVYYPATKKYGRSLRIAKSNITPDIYKLYKFPGTTILAPSCGLWAGRWHIYYNLGRYCAADNPEILNAKWDVYVSLKFEGPAYSKESSSTENRVSCDRVILVKK